MFLPNLIDIRYTLQLEMSFGFMWTPRNIKYVKPEDSFRLILLCSPILNYSFESS